MSKYQNFHTFKFGASFGRSKYGFVYVHTVLTENEYEQNVSMSEPEFQKSMSEYELQILSGPS